MFNHTSKYGEEFLKKHSAEIIWQNLRSWKCDGMWSSVFELSYAIHTSMPIFSTETKTEEKKAN